LLCKCQTGLQPAAVAGVMGLERVAANDPKPIYVFLSFMKQIDYVFAVLLGIAYIVLIGFITPMSATWGGSIPSDDFWGQSNATSVAYMQIYHSIGIVLAALPVSAAIAWRHTVNWFHPTTIAAIIGGLYMLFNQLRGVWILAQNEISPQTFYIVSGVIDVVKIPLILLIVTAGLTRIFAEKRRLT